MQNKNPIKRMYINALNGKYSIGAFNFSTSDIASAIFMAAQKLRAPIILATSSGEMKHLTPEVAKGIAGGLQKRENLLALHLDHGKRLEDIKKAIAAGYDSVHCDGSALEFKENIGLTKKAADYASRKGIWIEGEIGHIEGSSTLHKSSYEKIRKEMVMTDPEQARDFAEKTGIDSLAVNIGNAHGIWKGSPDIEFNRLEAIYKKVKIPLVLHGGSGIPELQIRKALKYGIAKINVNTELRIAFSDSLRKSLLGKKQFIPTKYMPYAINAVQKVVERKIRLFGTANKL